VLGDAAHFFVRHLSLPDGIQETRFPVIHMTEYGNYWWPDNQIGFIIPVAETAGGQCAGLLLILGHPGPNARSRCNQSRHVVINYLVTPNHDATTHQLLDDGNRALIHQFGQSLYS
jgi:hypothetical protein